MYIAIRTDDGRNTGKISFYCNTLQVSRQAFYDYLGRKDKPWKYQPLADAMRKIHDEDEENADYGRVRMYQALKYGKEVGKLKATPHKTRQKTLHVINLQIFRHITNNFLTIRQYAFKNSMQSDEKYICVSAAQASCGIALTTSKSMRSNRSQRDGTDKPDS